MSYDATVARAVGVGTTPLIRALLLSAILSTASSAQERTLSPFEGVSRTTPVILNAQPDTRPAGPAPVALRPTPDSHVRASPDRIAGGALLGSAGSFGLMYAGALAGWMSAGDGCNLSGMLAGAAAGSVLGATLGSAAVVGNPTRAFVGSIGGGLLGLVAAMGVSGLGHDTAAFVTYSLVQGATASVVAGR